MIDPQVNVTNNDRSAILSNAKYLRNIRPIDPTEIAEYIEGRAHPHHIRDVLRDAAFDLEVVERPDGTFVPISDGPIHPHFDGITKLPTRYEGILRAELVRRYGPEWADDESGDEIRNIIRLLKDAYFRSKPVSYDYDVAMGYAIYHFPGYYATIQYVLDELGARKLIPSKLRILDLGAGVGGPALGIHDYLSDDTLVAYDAVEPSAAADLLERFLESSGNNFHTSINRTTVEQFTPEHSYDVILFANVLSELDDPVSVVQGYLPSLSETGSLIAIAPADKNTSIGLRNVERRIVKQNDEITVFAPTLRLWPGKSPTDRGWSFDVKPDLETPSIQRQLDEGRRMMNEQRGVATGEFINRSVQYSYVILRSDGVRRVNFSPSPHRFAKLSQSDRHVTDRINVAAVKLSHSLAECDANPIFKVGDGSERQDHYAVHAKETMFNRILGIAEYGDVLAFERVLVLWNDDEAAFNLVVDEGTVVERISPPR